MRCPTACPWACKAAVACSRVNEGNMVVSGATCQQTRTLRVMVWPTTTGLPEYTLHVKRVNWRCLSSKPSHTLSLAARTTSASATVPAIRKLQFTTGNALIRRSRSNAQTFCSGGARRYCDHVTSRDMTSTLRTPASGETSQGKLSDTTHHRMKQQIR